ncbi:MAG: ModD protein, partial [Synergistaceae bacterium]|nr:ModD protein [Synergistaceae bacterium]
MFDISDNYLDVLMDEDLPFMDLTTMSMGIASVPAIMECFPK